MASLRSRYPNRLNERHGTRARVRRSAIEPLPEVDALDDHMFMIDFDASSDGTAVKQPTCNDVRLKLEAIRAKLAHRGVTAGGQRPGSSNPEGPSRWRSLHSSSGLQNMQADDQQHARTAQTQERKLRCQLGLRLSR